MEDTLGENIYGAGGSFTVFATEAPSPAPTQYKPGCDGDSLVLTAPVAGDSYVPWADLTVSWTASSACMANYSRVQIFLFDDFGGESAASSGRRAQLSSMTATVGVMGLASIFMGLPGAGASPTTAPTFSPTESTDDFLFSSSGCLGNGYSPVYNITVFNSGSITLERKVLNTLNLTWGEEYFVCIQCKFCLKACNPDGFLF